jgi:tRNA modification GTPase
MRTIAATATAPGLSGIAVIRVSGDNAIEICDKIFIGKSKISDMKASTIRYGEIIDDKNIIDQVTVSLFKSPRSYTGEDIVEISCHGGNIISSMILELLYKNGAYPAEAGEFTKRAFLNGKLDLTQAEAVADMIHSISTPSARTAARQLSGGFSKKLSEFRSKLVEICSLLEIELDFLDDDIQFTDSSKIINLIDDSISYCKSLIDSFKSAEILRSGFKVAIVGKPNSGKSTLFNALLNKNRAIVSDIPGTTRDYLEEFIYLGSAPIKIIDTAGLRESEDLIEIEGIKLVESLIKESDLILVINDYSISMDNSNSLISEIKDKYSEIPIIIAHNKIDISNIDNSNREYVYISAKHRIGLEDLYTRIIDIYNNTIRSNEDVLINSRHAQLLALIIDDLNNAKNIIQNKMDNELAIIDIRNAASKIGEISGETFGEEILNKIFSSFCIGK